MPNPAPFPCSDCPWVPRPCVTPAWGGREPRASNRVQWEEAPPPCVQVCVSVNERINEHDEDADGPSCLRKCSEQEVQ